MSQTTSSATVTPTRASISTPVRQIASTTARASTPRAVARTRTSLPVSGIGWQWGRSSGVRLMAASPAISAAGRGSPLAS